MIEVRVPNSMWAKRHIAQKDPKFPGGWNVHPAGKGSIDFGTAWLTAKSSALLVVPSVVVPAEENVLINPLHPDAKSIKAVNTGSWGFDHRLFGL
jgi:RES domain-containing protein